MRRIKQFQVSSTKGIYALTDDGILWHRGPGPEWEAIEPPGDGDPFKPALTDERLLKRLQRGDGFPKETLK